MTIAKFKEKLEQTPKQVEFQDTMRVIEDHYNFELVKFVNGEVINEASQNSGSCKLFAFAQLQKLSKQETLYCFGSYYRDVLKTPGGDDHQNIRNFIKTGWEGISFKKFPLKPKV